MGFGGLFTSKQLYTIFLWVAVLIVPVAAHSASLDTIGDTGSVDYQMPTTDRPPIYEGGPISVPVKALIQRVTRKAASTGARQFRYDIDTLGRGMAVRFRFRF